MVSLYMLMCNFIYIPRYGFHVANCNETHKCSTALYGDLVYQISPVLYTSPSITDAT